MKFPIIFLALLLFVPTLHSDGLQAAWSSSVGTLIGGTYADIRASYGLRELNPVLGVGQFGTRQAATAVVTTGGSLALQALIWRHTTRRQKAVFTIANFVVSGVHFWLARRVAH